MTTDPRDGLMSMRELAEALGVTRQRVWQIARARGLGRKVGHALLFTQADLKAMRARAWWPRKNSTEGGSR